MDGARRPTADEIPVIDASPLLGADPAARRATARQIGAACRGTGFFYVRDHGVPDALVAAMFAASARFFARPVAEKLLASIKLSNANRGYVGLEDEALDPSRPADLKEAFNIGLDLAPDDPAIAAGLPFHAVNRWPPGDAAFRDTMLAYYAACRRLSERLCAAFALALDLPEAFFAPLIDRPLATLRVLHYPPHPAGAAAGQFGAAPHSDYGIVTVLAQDDRGGLQVRHASGEWLEAVPIPGTFVCNIGDLMARWTNDRFASTLHRVVNRSGRERHSAAFFFDPNHDAAIACLPSCHGPGDPPKYPPTTGGRYLDERLNATYAHRRQA